LLQLDLRDVTMMVQDWGGPIGFSVATRHPDRFSTFVIGNTWGWPKSDPGGGSSRGSSVARSAAI
jgi:haloalkane dehalogenase